MRFAPGERRPTAAVGSGAATFAIYLAISILLFFVPVAGDPSHAYVGFWHPDPFTFMWFLAWWPHAIGHGLNPFVTNEVWAPGGVNLAWTTSVPGPALVAAPVTLLFGPVVAYNAVMVVAPALSGWAAFLLCRYVTRSFWPSLVGGYLFGFSTFELGQMLNHMNLSITFAVPLVAYLVVRRLRDDLGTRSFVPLLALVLAAQFLVSTELLFGVVVFGFASLLGAYALFGPRERDAIRAAIVPILAAGAAAAVLVSPYLFYLLRGPIPSRPIHPLVESSSDLVNLIVPTRITLLSPISFPANLAEAGAYVGVPLLLALALLARELWHSATVRFLVFGFVFFVLISLGPVLHFRDRQIVSLPWKLVDPIPLLNSMLPERFMLYAFLFLSVGIAVWLSSATRTSTLAKWLLVGIGFVALFPDIRPSSAWWKSDVSVPSFFADGAYRRYVRRNDTVTIIPYPNCGPSMLWQARSGFFFKMAGGYVGVTPPSFARSPTVGALYSGVATPASRQDLPHFLDEYRVRAVLVADGTPGDWSTLFSPLGHPRKADGVSVYRVSQPLAGVAVGQGDGHSATTQAGPSCSPTSWVRGG